MSILTIPHPVNGVYLQLSNRAALMGLLRYALTHEHSRQWVGPITLWLQRGGPAHG